MSTADLMDERGFAADPPLYMNEELKVLVIEDERAIADAVALNLREEGYVVQVVHRGDDGLRIATTEPQDLIVLDLMLPGADGRDICRAVRKRSQTPILMLTARAREMDKVLGLELGADDYLTKPFGMLELIARVKALLRRSRANQPAEDPDREEEYVAGNVSVNVSRHRVMVDGKQVDLRPKEFELVRALIGNRGRVMTRDRLLELVWGEDEFLDRGTLDVHIRWLRQKLERDPGSPQRIITVRGVGYKYSEEAD
ncbi:MAG: winged helix-turn-helix domain-containing protein [Actinomycetota bacterium]